MIEKEENGHDYSPAVDPDAGRVKNLWEKLADVMLNVGYIQKLGQHQNFKYAKSIDIRRVIRVELGIRHIIMIPRVSSEPIQTQAIVKTKYGERNVTRTQLPLQYIFINGDNPIEREVCDWYGWSEGSEAFAAYGCMTGGQRHFLESLLLLLTGEEDPESLGPEYEESTVKNNAEKSKAIADKMNVPIVGTPPSKIPDKEDLRDHDPSSRHEDETFDDWWETIKVKMCEGLEKMYPNGTVGAIRLSSLIKAQSYVNRVLNGQDLACKSPAHTYLARALSDRFHYELDMGTIEKVSQPDGSHIFKVVGTKNDPLGLDLSETSKKELAPSLFSK